MPAAPIRRNDANHDRTFGAGMRNIATASEATQQRLRSVLLVIFGEWFLNVEEGIPWWQPEDSDTKPILGGARNLPYSEGVLKKGINEVNGIAKLETFRLNSNPKTRRLSVTAGGTDVDGNPFLIVDHGP